MKPKNSDKPKRPRKQKAYKTNPRAMGLKPWLSLDNIQELLAQVEGEDRRRINEINPLKQAE